MSDMTFGGMMPGNIIERDIDEMINRNVDAAIKEASGIVAKISGIPSINADLINLRTIDDYTYHHSVNVAVYSVAVGIKMGLSDNELKELAEAGICHDLGKRMIPLEIIDKPGKLTDEEYAEIKKHTKYSFEILYDKPEISTNVRQAVLFHHENENGSGYPLGKEGDSIPLLAKIIHAVDVYDALTTKRSYKKPFSPAEALDYLVGGKEILFDSDVIDNVIRAIPAYPIGIKVTLSTKETGEVVGQSSNGLRPIVKLNGTGAIVNLNEDDGYKAVAITDSSLKPMDYVEDIDSINEERAEQGEYKECILIVDDSKISLMQTKAALDDEYDIVSCLSGAEAISYINNPVNRRPALIIMDVEMPGLDGISTVIRISKTEPDIPVIFLTASCDKMVVMRCRAVGATDYLVKPAKPVYIKQRVGIALKKIRE